MFSVDTTSRLLCLLREPVLDLRPRFFDVEGEGLTSSFAAAFFTRLSNTSANSLRPLVTQSSPAVRDFTALSRLPAFSKLRQRHIQKAECSMTPGTCSSSWFSQSSMSSGGSGSSKLDRRSAKRADILACFDGPALSPVDSWSNERLPGCCGDALVSWFSADLRTFRMAEPDDLRGLAGLS